MLSAFAERYRADPEFRAQHLEASRADYRKRRDRVLSRFAEKYRTDPDFKARRAAYSKASYEKNKAVHLATSKAWYLNHPERTRELRVKSHAARYGLTPAEVEAMRVAQNGLCGICGLPPRNSRMVLVIDHDHATGRVRGLLCDHCNRMIGYAAENAETLMRAAEWVR